MKLYFLRKIKSKKNKMASAAILLGALWVNIEIVYCKTPYIISHFCYYHLWLGRVG